MQTNPAADESIQLILITSSPSTASLAGSVGVDRIMVDLEIIGKQERQGHLDTLISAHSIEDVGAMRRDADPPCMIVRTNPLHDGIQQEIDAVLAFEPQFLMLPMVRSHRDVLDYAQCVRGRAGIIPLVETADGIEDIAAISALPETTEVYIGLNDLHLDLGCRFIFEPLADGLVDRAAEAIRSAGKRFGFGGIARMDEGTIPGSMILEEHLRLGSGSVILSRTFHRRGADDGSLQGRPDVCTRGQHTARCRSCLPTAGQCAAGLGPATVCPIGHNTDRHRVKRLFDILVSATILLILLPLGMLVALAVVVDSGRPALFRQVRIGRHCRPFEMLKFRSMRVGADREGSFRTEAGDARITRVGRLIRRTSLDELPQLVNVLRGDMSLVGPRPDTPQQESDYAPEDWHRRHAVRPGITGMAQAHGRSSVTPGERLRMDLDYVRRSSLWLDLRILARTVTHLFAKDSN